MDKLRFLPYLLLFLSVQSTAGLITITDSGITDGIWDIDTVYCNRNESSCHDILASQVWFGDRDLAYIFAFETGNSLGFPNQPSQEIFGPWFFYDDSSPYQDVHLGWSIYKWDKGIADYNGGNDVEYWATAQLVDNDADDDGIPDYLDDCKNDPLNWCSLQDIDGDGTPDDFDECPSDATNTCNQIIDSDGDGIEDSFDECPSDPTNQCNVVVIPDPDPNPVPEPSILALMTAGLFSLGFVRRRKQQA